MPTSTSYERLLVRARKHNSQPPRATCAVASLACSPVVSVHVAPHRDWPSKKAEDATEEACAEPLPHRATERDTPPSPRGPRTLHALTSLPEWSSRRLAILPTPGGTSRSTRALVAKPVHPASNLNALAFRLDLVCTELTPDACEVAHLSSAQHPPPTPSCETPPPHRLPCAADCRHSQPPQRPQSRAHQPHPRCAECQPQHHRVCAAFQVLLLAAAPQPHQQSASTQPPRATCHPRPGGVPHHQEAQLPPRCPLEKSPPHPLQKRHLR